MSARRTTAFMVITGIAGIIAVSGGANAAVMVQRNPQNHGLDRIDQRDLPLSNTYSVHEDGKGVTVYVVDTGIRTTHKDFGGRAVSGIDVIDGGKADDCNGHGTQVAGIIGGRTYGVAKAVKLVAVRVLDCNGNGTDAGIAKGLDWVVKDHKPGQPAVINMSLGGGASTVTDNAVKRAIADGITVVVAAGNDGQVLLGGLTGASDSCYSSPSRVPDAITVAAVDKSDKRSAYSSYGRCVDIFAPGNNILSDWNTSDTATQYESGTSQATPFVSGAAALYLSVNSKLSPAAVTAKILAAATTGKVKNAGSRSPNRLLFIS